MRKNSHKKVFVTAASLRIFSDRFAPIFFLLVSFFLMLLTGLNNQFQSQMRVMVTDVFSPVLSTLSVPLEKAAMSVDAVAAFSHMAQENVHLKEENERLKKWYQMAVSLKVENERLAALLNLTKEPGRSYITTRVITDPSAPFYQTALVPAGRDYGVKTGHAAISNEGLVGRVTDVGQNSARVLLATDISSRIPIFIGDHKSRAILAGNNTEMPELDHFQRGVEFKVGDRIITSGQGGVFAPGVPVGVIEKIEDLKISVRLFTNLHQLDYVQIVDFGDNLNVE